MLLCRISTSVVYQLPKLRRRVRFPLSAPRAKNLPVASFPATRRCEYHGKAYRYKKPCADAKCDSAVRPMGLRLREKE